MRALFYEGTVIASISSPENWQSLCYSVYSIAIAEGQGLLPAIIATLLVLAHGHMTVGGNHSIALLPLFQSHELLPVTGLRSVFSCRFYTFVSVSVVR